MQSGRPLLCLADRCAVLSAGYAYRSMGASIRLPHSVQEPS